MEKKKISKFQERVFKIVSEIAKGEVMSYGEIAKQLKTSPRAVGQALKFNPYHIKIPCHRVIKSNGEIGGYKGKAMSIEKQRLLRGEGFNTNYKKD
jgi:methylated-DNA-[protein]-cysteine S-methyltransferase